MRIEGLRNEKKSLEDSLRAPGEMKGITYSDMPKSNNVSISLDRLIPMINRIDVAIEREEMILKYSQSQLELIAMKLKNLSSIESQILKLLKIDKLSHKQVMVKLSMSRATFYRVLKKIKQKTKVETF